MDFNKFLGIQNDPKENIPRENRICMKCNKIKLCIYIDCENICIDCYKGLNSLMYCHNCNNLFEKENNKYCYKCNKITGDCCGALYFSQSIECICKKCYSYNCIVCKEKTLSKERQYIADDEKSSIFSPICDRCRKNIEI